MRDWSLTSEDALALTISADGRIAAADVLNDHIWEVEWGSGDPPALSLFTTYGLRARSMRIFQRFREGTKRVSAPEEFARAPVLRAFYPNFLHFSYQPFPGIEVEAEYWVPESHALVGRLTVLNRSEVTRHLRLETCGLLIPLQGLPLTVRRIHLANVLVGQSSNLSPVIFMTGDVEPGEGPYPSLRVDFSLLPGGTRQVVWAQVALEHPEEGFEQARRWAARPWDAERARLELLNASHQLEITTGEPSWDVALAMAQKEAARLVLGHPSLPFVATRRPEDGYSSQGNGSDYPAAWQGLTPIEAFYLATLLPTFGANLLQCFLERIEPSGFIPLTAAAAHRSVLATPLLATFAQRFASALSPQAREALRSFFWQWFSPAQDGDRDGIPQWSHLPQSGLEDHPLFDLWHPWSQGVDVGAVHSPALLTFLLREAEALQELLRSLPGRAEQKALLEAQAARLHSQLARAWHSRTAAYRYLDRQAQSCFGGAVLLRHRGAGQVKVGKRFKSPRRLVLEISCEPAECRPEVTLWENGEAVEHFPAEAWRWRSGGLTVTSARLYSALDAVQVSGIQPDQQLLIRVPNLTMEDVTTLVPLWAGVPTPLQAQALVGHVLNEGGRFNRPFGVPLFARPPAREAETLAQRVDLFWNLLIGEGLLRYGFRAQAAQLVGRLMRAVITALRQQRAFYRYYHAESGAGLGERGHLLGLAPLGLFLKTLGVEIYSPTRVRLEGYNPFPWPVRLRYRDLEVLRQANETEIIFPQGQRVVVTTTAPCLVTLREGEAEISAAA